MARKTSACSSAPQLMIGKQWSARSKEEWHVCFHPTLTSVTEQGACSLSSEGEVLIQASFTSPIPNVFARDDTTRIFRFWGLF